MRCNLRNLLLAGLLAAMYTLAGCNTVEGFGKDMKAAGRTIDNTADNVKQDMND